MLKKILTGLSLLPTLPVLAHEGHGLPGHSHWHATDTFGYLVLGVFAIAAIWWLTRK